MIRLKNTKFFPRNAKNNDRNGVNKQNAPPYTSERVTYYENKNYPPLFLKQTPYFNILSLFMGKISENLENSNITL